MNEVYYFSIMFEIKRHTPFLDTRWDRFVEEESVNGTFLQTRRFLNYHPANRFRDESFVIEKSGTIAAAFPGNRTHDNEFVSHGGSTFGGPVIGTPFYTGGRIQEILEIADRHFSNNFKKVTLKITPSLFCLKQSDLLEYSLEHMGYTRHSELSAFTILKRNDDPLDSCDKECRRTFRKSEIFPLIYRDFETREDYEIFYTHLVKSKEKHGTSPVHTIDELMDLREKRITDELRFRGLWDASGNYIAGIMLFLFKKAQVIHAQYIAPNENFDRFNPTTAMYIHSLREAKMDGFKKFSWGISTEEGGRILNINLFKFKESFGAEASVNVFYTKEF